MQKDYAIEFNGKVKELQDNLKKIEEINIDVTNFKDALKNIEMEVSIEIKNNYSKYNEINQITDLEEANAKTYCLAVTEVEELNKKFLKEYDAYYKIDIKYKNLQKRLKDVTEDNLADIILECQNMLNLLKTSSNIDYSLEKNLTENVFQITYKIIKLELLYNNTSGLLYYIKNSLVFQNYIIDLIKEEVNELDNQKTDVKILLEKIAKEKEKGLNDSFLLNKDIIAYLATLTDKSLSKKAREKFINAFKEYQLLADDFYNTQINITNTQSSIEKIKKSLKKNRLKIFNKKALLTLNLVLVTSSIVGSIIAIGKVTKEKEYKVTTTVYDSSTDEKEITEEYKKIDSDTLSLVEYSPWDRPGYFRDEYTKNVYTYSLEDFDKSFSDIKDYLTKSLKGKITYEEKKETTKEKPKDLEYSKNKYVITELRKDEDDFRMVNSKFWWSFFSKISILIILIADFFILKKLYTTKFKDLKINQKELKKELKSCKELLLKYSNDLDYLSQQILLSKCEAIDTYEKTSELIKETKDIKEKIKLITKN